MGVFGLASEGAFEAREFLLGKLFSSPVPPRPDIDRLLGDAGNRFSGVFERRLLGDFVTVEPRDSASIERMLISSPSPNTVFFVPCFFPAGLLRLMGDLPAVASEVLASSPMNFFVGAFVGVFDSLLRDFVVAGRPVSADFSRVVSLDACEVLS